jgi:hypothetical protein
MDGPKGSIELKPAGVISRDPSGTQSHRVGTCPWRRALGRRSGQSNRAWQRAAPSRPRRRQGSWSSAKLETFGWQAPDFYAKRGYQEFGRIDNHTIGYYLAFMRKKL